MRQDIHTAQQDLLAAERYAEEHLDGRLLEHTRGCVDTARKLAHKLGLDADKAGTAAWLHDVAKRFPRREQVVIARRLGMSEAEIASYLPPVLHGPLAALIARNELSINDPDVLQAIATHSSGCAGMCDVAKVVFISDYIELTRSFPGAEELRSHGDVTLNELAAAILKRKLIYLLDEQKDIDLRAITFWNELMVELGR
jgi:predicted HD superfamily hydrolase involved in NAD metabolism